MRSTITIPLALALSAVASAQDIQTAPYKDSLTGITFTGFADGTGYQFGMVLPESPTTDFVVQLISPLTKGAGWAGIDFGASMTGRLLVVAWPNGNEVMMGPYFASGYEVSDTAAYDGPGASSIKLSPISQGTFVNSTHVVATFVCGGCMTADSFTAANASGQGLLAYAYSSVAVANPSSPDTQLSDHTTGNEPYGSFTMNFAEAKSAQYATYAAMAGSASGSSTASSSSTTTPTSGAAQSSSASSNAGSTGGSYPTTTGYGSGSLSAGMIVLLTGVGVVYMIQPFI